LIGRVGLVIQPDRGGDLDGAQTFGTVKSTMIPSQVHISSKLTLWTRFLLGLFVVISLPTVSRAESSTSDGSDYWAFASQGSGVKQCNVGWAGVPIFISTTSPLRIVDTSSDPKNPFPDSESALYMEPLPENMPIRMRNRPFAKTIPARGWYEFNFRLMEGAIYLGVVTITNPWEQENPAAYAGKRFQTFEFILGEPVKPSGQAGLVTDNVETLGTDENYAFRVAWEIKNEVIEFSLFLNGSALTEMDGRPFIFSIKQSEMEGGVLGFIIGSGSKNSQNARAFFGKILAKDLTE